VKRRGMIGAAGGALLAAAIRSPARAASPQGVFDAEVRVGVIADLSGPIASAGVPIRNGMQMRFDEANEAGGIHGRHIRPYFEDSGYDTKRSVLLTQKLLQQSQVFAMLGVQGSPAIVTTLPEVLDAGLPFLFPASFPRVTFEPFHPLKFAFVPANDDMMERATRHAVSSLGFRRIGLLVQDDDYGAEVRRGAETALRAAGLAPVEATTYKRGATDFSSQVARLNAAGVDLVLLGTGIRETIGPVQEARTNGWGMQFLVASPGYTTDIPELGGAAMDGLYAVSPFTLPEAIEDGPEMTAWIARYRSRFGASPKFYSGMGYTIANLFLEGLRNAGPQLTPQTYAAGAERIALAPDFLGNPPYRFTPQDHLGNRSVRGVIVSRGRDGGIHVFLNSCTHRGNRVCFAEVGNARRFTCNYHGWSFGNDGSLLGLPEEQLYTETCPGFDKSKLGLHRARVSTYKGLVFASFANDAPSLDEYLGDFRWYLDVLLDNDEGGTEFLDGNIKSRIRCNWKLPAENFIGDGYHAPWTHHSGAVAMLGTGVGKFSERSYHANVNGHGWEFGLDMVGNAMTLGEQDVVDYLRERERVVAERLGKLRSRMVGSLSSATAFPNFSFLAGHNAFRVWLPRGPREIELHTWVLVNRSAPEALKAKYRRGVMRTFSPSGTLEMDDGENWENATAANAGIITRRQPLCYGLGMNSRIDHEELPGNVHHRVINDSNQRAFYGRWLDFMTAERWADVPVRR